MAEPYKVSSVNKAPVAIASVADKKILVVYFSRTGEEEYNVNIITKGNTAIVAEYVAQKNSADMFEIKPAPPYPDEYEAYTKITKKRIIIKLTTRARKEYRQFCAVRNAFCWISNLVGSDAARYDDFP